MLLEEKMMAITKPRKASWTAAAPRRFFDRAPKIEFNKNAGRKFNRFPESPCSLQTCSPPMNPIW
jgi:hypothetical protein